MKDVSNYTLDTPVLIKLLDPGIWIPELSTYTPLESYASIEKVINIMNRGLQVEFPGQSSEREISNKIEELLLQYQERKNFIKATKHIDVGTNIDTALDVVQEINDNKLTLVEQQAEREKDIFNNSDIDARIIENLSNNDFRVFEGDDFVSPEDRIQRSEKIRKSTENVKKKRSELLREFTLESETLKRLAQDANYDESSFAFAENLNLVDTNLMKKENISYEKFDKKK